MQHRELRLKQLEQTARGSAEGEAGEGAGDPSALAQQRRLLASIHTTIQSLQAQEAQREQAQRAAALARLRQELAARKAAERAAAAAAASQPTPTPTTPIVPPPVNVPPVGNGGAGHPQAASIALQYLGVPYV